MGVGRFVFRMFMGVTAHVPWVPAYAGTTVRGEGVRSEPGTTVEWVWAVLFFGCLWG